MPFPRLVSASFSIRPDQMLFSSVHSFLNALLALAGQDAAAQLPATEVELLKLWWDMGGVRPQGFLPGPTPSQNLLNAAAADRLAHAPNEPIFRFMICRPNRCEELKSAGVLRDKEFGHSVVFAHDIYEEWAPCASS